MAIKIYFLLYLCDINNLSLINLIIYAENATESFTWLYFISWNATYFIFRRFTLSKFNVLVELCLFFQVQSSLILDLRDEIQVVQSKFNIYDGKFQMKIYTGRNLIGYKEGCRK